MRKILVWNIDWDTSDEDEKFEAPELPTEVEIENPNEEMVQEVEENGYCEDVENYLSDKYGFCVNGFCVGFADE